MRARIRGEFLEAGAIVEPAWSTFAGSFRANRERPLAVRFPPVCATAISNAPISNAPRRSHRLVRCLAPPAPATRRMRRDR
jgi:hypothetical protein